MATKKSSKKLTLKKKVTRKNGSPYKFPCMVIKQGKFELVCFVADAKTIWEFVEVNQYSEDKVEGYQRVLSPSRVNTVARYIDEGNSVPNSVLISLEEGSTLSAAKDHITIPCRSDAGWVIDGQHRLAGAYNAKNDIQFAVIAFLGLDIDEQIHQFVTINREAKNVPTSLYYFLLKRLPPNKSEADMAKEVAVDIASELKKNPESPFYQKIVITPPKPGELSLTNFVRKVAPLVTDKRGLFHTLVLNEQIGVIDNYYRALKHIFPEYFHIGKQIFFKTLGFGAMINALPTVFSLTLTEYNGFRVQDVAKILSKVEDFDFSSWEKAGTGVQAEAQAGEDFRQSLLARLQGSHPEGTSLRLF
ncbi:MAG TPA: DGQHR domain-containing protein [Pyrinomonadaceae bacterium]|nr:DGQHR domain-containing protein [Pyrinomonadaceae bacterium]